MCSVFFFKQKTAYEMRISDWSSDVCSSDLPGCYVTAMQLAIAPMLAELDGPVQCFGVSGYSGAGTTPSDRNDPDKLRDNLMPYALTGHVHEREVSARLGHPIEFMPHVASHFRGITFTANLHLTRPFERDEMPSHYRETGTAAGRGRGGQEVEN